MYIPDLKNEIFYVVNVETTGFNINSFDIVELAALKVLTKHGEFRVLDSFESLVDPEIPLPERCAKIYKEKYDRAVSEHPNEDYSLICNEVLKRSPTMDMIADKLRSFLGDHCIIVGHNAEFATEKIREIYMQGNWDASPLNIRGIVDTLDICRKFLPTQDHELSRMLKLTNNKFSGNITHPYSSIEKCYATLDVLEYMKEAHYKDLFKEPAAKDPYGELGALRPDNDAERKENFMHSINASSSLGLSFEIYKFFENNKNVSEIIIEPDFEGHANRHFYEWAEIIYKGEEATLNSAYASDRFGNLNNKPDIVMSIQRIPNRDDDYDISVIGYYASGKKASPKIQMSFEKEEFWESYGFDSFLDRIAKERQKSTIKDNSENTYIV